MLKYFCLAACLFFLTLSIDAQENKTKVLLLGTFHFDNPGLDVAKFENVNILTEKRQAEVKVVLQKLLDFRPDKIFVEAPPSAQARLDSNFNKYKAGELALKAGELHQIGFRLAKELNLPGLLAVDYTEAEFPFDSLVKSATEAKQFYLLGYFKNTIDSIQRVFNESLKVKTVRELLLDQNTREVTALQVGMYYDFLVAGKEGNHVGSYLTSEWWRRNMIIYENILKRLNGREERILVIFGSGHTALLEEMMKYNKKIEIVQVHKVL